MRILITGAAGFIGSHLAYALLDEGHSITGVDDLSTGRQANYPAQEAFFEGDIRESVPQDDWDVIYHCAASYKDRSDWERDASVNVLGTINVVREAQRSKAKLIYFQTSLCYGPNPASPIDLLAPLAPVGSYAVSKTAGEAYIRDSGVEWVSLRLANIYGPRNLSGPIPTFYKRLSEGQPCTVVDSRRDFVYIDDLVRIAMMVRQRGHGIYHVSSGRDCSILRIYELVQSAMGFPSDTPIVTPRGPDDVSTILLSPADTYEEFGWSARTPLVAGIARAVSWYRSFGVAETFTHLATKG
jgi:UDP-glucose 4-epimerase